MVTTSHFVNPLKALFYGILLTCFASTVQAETFPEPDTTAKTAESSGLKPFVQTAPPSNELQLFKLNKDLVYQAFFGNAEEIQKLIALGANPNALNDKNIPALSLAAQRKTPEGNEVVKALLANGGNINAQDNNGQTPIFYAARVGNLPTVMLLLQMGADYYLTDKSGNIARNIAYTQGHKEVFEAMDGFVNDKRESVLKAYADKNAKIKQRNEDVKKQNEAKRALPEVNETVSTMEITLVPTEEQRTEFVQRVFDLAYSSCAYQYFYLESLYDLKTDMTSEALYAAMEKYKKVADNSSKSLIEDFKSTNQVVNQIIKPSQQEITRKLDAMGSNITRKSNGVGTLADMKERCNDIGARITLLAAPEAPEITKTVPIEAAPSAEDAPSKATAETPESSANPAKPPPSDPADEEDKTDGKSPLQESL